MTRIIQGISRFFRNEDPILLRILILALVAKLFLLLVILVRLGEFGIIGIVDDGTTYQQIAQNILAGNGYSMVTAPPFVPDAIRVPIIPYLMAFSLKVFQSLIPVSLLGGFLSLAHIWIIWHIIRMLGGKRSLSIIGAAFMAFEPAGLMLSVLAISEPIFVTFSLVVVYLAVKWKAEILTWNYALLAGLFLGLAAMTRPIGLYLIPIVVVWLLCVRPKSWKYVLLTFVLASVLVAPWFVRNERVFGVTTFTSGGVQNLYFHFGSTLISLRDNVSINKTNVAQYEEAAKISGLTMRQVEQQDLRLNALLRDRAFDLILQNPAAAIKTLAYAEFAFFTNDSYRFYYLNRLFHTEYNATFNPTLEMFQDPMEAFPKLFRQMKQEYFLSFFGRAFFAITSLLGVLGLVVLTLRKETRAVGILLFLILAYVVAGSITGGHGITVRYRYPIQGFLYVGTLFAVDYLWSLRLHRKKYENL